MSDSIVNIRHKLAQIHDFWTPKIVAQLNDYHFKLAKVQGEFIWHSHPETDEVFYVLEGQLKIEMEDQSVVLKEGELFVIPRGVRHRPVAEKECHLMLVEPAGTVNTGDAGGDRTVKDERI